MLVGAFLVPIQKKIFFKVLTMCSSDHAVSFLPCHRQTIIRYLQLGSCNNSIIQLLPLSEGDMTRQVILPEGEACGQYNLSRVTKSSCHPHSTIVLLY